MRTHRCLKINRKNCEKRIRLISQQIHIRIKRVVCSVLFNNFILRKIYLHVIDSALMIKRLKGINERNLLGYP